MVQLSGCVRIGFACGLALLAAAGWHGGALLDQSFVFALERLHSQGARRALETHPAPFEDEREQPATESATHQASSLWRRQPPAEQPPAEGGLPTFSVIARFFWGEIPFIDSFISHYVRLGVGRVFLVVTEEGDLSSLREHLALRVNASEESGSEPQEGMVTTTDGGEKRVICVGLRVCLIVLGSGKLSKLGALSGVFKEDYLIAVDVDEFLVPPERFSSLAELFATSPDTDVFDVRWAMCPYGGDGEGPHPAGTCIRQDTTKYIIKRTALVMLGDISNNVHHPHRTTCGDKCKITKLSNNLIHFQYRGIMDVIFKECGAFKSSGAEELAERLARREPGKRMKLMAFSVAMAEKFGEHLALGNRTPAFSVDQRSALDVFARHVYPDMSAALPSRQPKEVLGLLKDVYGQFAGLLRDESVWRELSGMAKLSPQPLSKALDKVELRDLASGNLQVHRYRPSLGGVKQRAHSTRRRHRRSH